MFTLIVPALSTGESDPTRGPLLVDDQFSAGRLDGQIRVRTPVRSLSPPPIVGRLPIQVPIDIPQRINHHHARVGIRISSGCREQPPGARLPFARPN